MWKKSCSACVCLWLGVGQSKSKQTHILEVRLICSNYQTRSGASRKKGAWVSYREPLCSVWNKHFSPSELFQPKKQTDKKFRRRLRRPVSAPPSRPVTTQLELCWNAAKWASQLVQDVIVRQKRCEFFKSDLCLWLLPSPGKQLYELWPQKTWTYNLVTRAHQ